MFDPDRRGRFRLSILAFAVSVFYPDVGTTQDTARVDAVGPTVHRIIFSEQPPPRVDLTRGVRARVLAVDSSGKPVGVEGVIVSADRRSLTVGCTPVWTVAEPTSGITGGRRLACDSGLETFRWSQVEDFRVRRLRTASHVASVGNGALGTIEGGLLGAFVGGAMALTVQYIWTSIEKHDGTSDPRVYWPDVRRVAIGFAAAGALGGGAAAFRWSRGHWKNMPLPGDPGTLSEEVMRP